MKYVVATFLAGLLSLGSLVPQNDLGELAKKSRPAYYHFHHSPAGGCLTLVEFLVVHYRPGTKHYFGCTFSGQHQQDHQRFPLYGSHHGAVTGRGNPWMRGLITGGDHHRGRHAAPSSVRNSVPNSSTIPLRTCASKRACSYGRILATRC